MKITKYFLPIFCTVLFILSSCSEDYRMPTLSREASLRHLSFRGISRVSTSRGFTMNTALKEQQGRLIKSSEINFEDGTWDNSHNKPRLLLIVKSKTNNEVFWAEMLDTNSYEYVRDSSPSPSIRINKRISYSRNTPIAEQKLVVYAFDNQLSYNLRNNGTTSPNYEISIQFPSLERVGNTKAYKLHTADKENQKLIFKKELELTTVKEHSDKNTKYSFTMDPLGVLLVFDLRNISSSTFTLPQNYLIRIKTNGFSFEDVTINCVSDKATHSPIYEYSGNEDRVSYGWDSNGNIDFHKILDVSKAGVVDYTDIQLLSDRDTELGAYEKNNALQKSNRSSIYALYVMPTTSEEINGTTKYNMLNITHPDELGSSAKEKYLFKYSKPVDFYSSLGSYRHLTLDVPSVFGSTSDIKDFDDKGGIDNNVNDNAEGNTKDFEDKGKLDNNVDDTPKGNTKDFDDKGKIDNNVNDTPKGNTKDFKDKGKLDNNVNDTPKGNTKDFKDKGKLDNNVNDTPKGNTKDFEDKGKLDNNVNDTPKGNTKDFEDKGKLDNNVDDTPKGNTKDFKDKNKLDNNVNDTSEGKMKDFKDKGALKNDSK